MSALSREELAPAESRLFPLVREIRTGKIPTRDEDGAYVFDIAGFKFFVCDSEMQPSSSSTRTYWIDHGPFCVSAKVSGCAGSVSIRGIDIDSPIASAMITAVRAVEVANFLNLALSGEASNRALEGAA